MPYITDAQLRKLPDFIRDRYRNVADEAERIFSTRPVPYPANRARLAETPDDIKNAHLLGRNTGQYQPFLEESQRRIQHASQAFPHNVDQYMSPYTNNVVNRISDEGARTFREKIMPQLEAKFVRLGQHGSQRHQEQSRLAARDLQEEIMARQNQALERGYQQAGQMFNADKARQMIGAEQMGNLGQAHQAGNLADIAMLTSQGQYLQNQDQLSKDMGYEDFIRRQQQEGQKLAQYMAHLQGIPYEVQQINVRNVPGAPQMNMMGNLGQLAGQIYGMRAAAGHARGGYIPHSRY